MSSESVEIRVGECAAVVPTSVFQALLEILALLGLGHGVRIEALDEELTTEEAARQLGVSRPYLVRLLEKGEIPFRKVGARPTWRSIWKFGTDADEKGERSWTSS
jgi:excisionase family DNA binding protein